MNHKFMKYGLYYMGYVIWEINPNASSAPLRRLELLTLIPTTESSRDCRLPNLFPSRL